MSWEVASCQRVAPLRVGRVGSARHARSRRTSCTSSACTAAWIALNIDRSKYVVSVTCQESCTQIGRVSGGAGDVSCSQNGFNSGHAFTAGSNLVWYASSTSLRSRKEMAQTHVSANSLAIWLHGFWYDSTRLTLVCHDNRLRCLNWFTKSVY